MVNFLTHVGGVALYIMIGAGVAGWAIARSWWSDINNDDAPMLAIFWPLAIAVMTIIVTIRTTYRVGCALGRVATRLGRAIRRTAVPRARVVKIDRKDPS